MTMKKGRIICEIALLVVVIGNFGQAVYWLGQTVPLWWLGFVFFFGFGCYFTKILIDCIRWQVQHKSL